MTADPPKLSALLRARIGALLARLSGAVGGLGATGPWGTPGVGLELPVSRRQLLTTLGLAAVAAGVVVAVVQSGLVSVPDASTVFVEELLDQYGYLALFVVFVVEGAMLLYFAPSESVVPAAIVLLADSGTDYVLVVVVAVLGATAGQTALFLLAKHGGRTRLLNNRWVTVDDARLDRFDAWFDRWGRLSIPASNTLLFTRGMLTVPAGLARLDTRTFVVLSALGTLCFETILAAVTLGVLNLL